MNQFTVKNRMFIQNNQPCFFLADTCWSAFTNATLQDWGYYVRYRANQGFNVLQINVLPQWDASKPAFEIAPFAKKSDGTFDFTKLDEAYFDRAEEMVKIAADHGLTCALVLLWVNYLPRTWATKLKKTQQFPLDYVEEYVQMVVQRFSKYKPIYIVSGDTDFPDDEVISYYEKALKVVKENDHKALTTLHIQGQLLDIPKVLEENPNLDFYMYQSGHNPQHQETAYMLAQQFYYHKQPRPIINGEPCYEQMGVLHSYGRYTRFDVRKVAWQSVLSGAGAGITYGAHGIWSWHLAGGEFGISGEAFETPYDWRSALKFEGAWDYAFLKSFIEEQQLFKLEPKAIVLNQTEEIRIAGHQGTLVAYVPYNTGLQLDGDYSNYQIEVIELETKKKVQMECTVEGGITKIPMHDFVGDCIYLLKNQVTS